MNRLLAGILLALALSGAGLLFWLSGDALLSLAFAAGLLGATLLLRLMPPAADAPVAAPAAEEAPDLALVRAALDAAGGGAALALTDDAGRLAAANETWSRWFGAAPPAELGEDGALAALVPAARRDGVARLDGLSVGGMRLAAEARAAGTRWSGWLLWRLGRGGGEDLAGEAQRLIGGEPGRRMGEAGLMAVLASGDGRILAANPAFALRAAGEESLPAAGLSLVDCLAASETGQFHFAAEGKDAPPLRIVPIPLEEGGAGAQPLSLFLLLDELAVPGGEGEAAHIHALLDSLPLGLALADTDGRFTFLNKAFRKAAGLSPQAQPAWPGDLVVDEDKAAVSDAVRRFARGRRHSGDMAIRLASTPDEPVALTVAGARGLGSAAVLLSLKDNSEEARLKREIAQATKMQAVGQLAGGVAHDFNNILTAILGTCDLMLMRHTPGDSDYDDIQQIRSNSNRAANLTRQLLAFSRQQTLRPRVLQLPDVVSEVSHLLKRLLGETVTLKVKHGRSLGAVRADPGQLEQVIVNLAVNARDAILARNPTGGGVLTLQTLAVPADEVRRMGTDILPVGDYTLLKVADTGTGIPAHLIGKIFEPFFTTKEVGKGTGLGLSTVYGIVKQSGGFIFAESEPGEGTTFSLYFPVHRAEPGEAAPRRAPKEKPTELWGSGTILLVEDETMVRTVAERALTRHGYTVLTAENGEAALEILGREERIDLMVSDVVMPTMDGPTTAREARATHPDLPILFISGYAEEQLRKSIDLPNVAFLAKPFSVQTLAETVRDTLNAK
jgi:two-component system, cell cycle sensor histidine kinase and response regulator CckA